MHSRQNKAEAIINYYCSKDIWRETAKEKKRYFEPSSNWKERRQKTSWCTYTLFDKRWSLIFVPYNCHNIYDKIYINTPLKSSLNSWLFNFTFLLFIIVFYTLHYDKILTRVLTLLNYYKLKRPKIKMSLKVFCVCVRLCYRYNNYVHKYIHIMYCSTRETSIVISVIY